MKVVSKLSLRILTIFAALNVMFTALPMTSHDAQAAVKVKSKKSFYDVSGKDGKTLNDNMVKEGRKVITITHAIAATRYDFDFSEPVIALTKNKCIVKKVDVTVNIEYIFPRWTTKNKASSDMRTHWRNFYRELQRHEEQHGKIAQKGAAALEKEILSFRGNKMFGCRDMGSFAAFKLDRVMRKTRAEQRLFDRREYSNSSKISKLQKKLYRAK